MNRPISRIAEPRIWVRVAAEAVAAGAAPSVSRVGDPAGLGTPFSLESPAAGEGAGFTAGAPFAWIGAGLGANIGLPGTPFFAIEWLTRQADRPFLVHRAGRPVCHWCGPATPSPSADHARWSQS